MPENVFFTVVAHTTEVIIATVNTLPTYAIDGLLSATVAHRTIVLHSCSEDRIDERGKDRARSFHRHQLYDFLICTRKRVQVNLVMNISYEDRNVSILQYSGENPITENFILRINSCYGALRSREADMISVKCDQSWMRNSS